MISDRSGSKIFPGDMKDKYFRAEHIPISLTPSSSLHISQTPTEYSLADASVVMRALREDK